MDKTNFLYSIIIVALFAIIFCSCGPRQKYVGKIIEVSDWDGKAMCLTKTKYTNKDTFVYVSPLRRQRFAVGETITFYTGGDLIVNAQTNSK